MLKICDNCGIILEASRQTTKRFCSTNCRVLWRYHNQIKTNQSTIVKEPNKPVYDPKNVPGFAAFKDKNGNIEFGYRHGVLEDCTTYYKGKGKYGYEE